MSPQDLSQASIPSFSIPFAIVSHAFGSLCGASSCCVVVHNEWEDIIVCLKIWVGEERLKTRNFGNGHSAGDDIDYSNACVWGFC